MEFRLIVIVGTALFFSVMWIISLFRSDGFTNAVKTLPPNVYHNPKSAYSNEDIAALINTLRKELSQHQQELPETIAKAIQNQVEPAIKGVLSRNHYVPQ
jgi:predicted PurR-regulated permease PerM